MQHSMVCIHQILDINFPRNRNPDWLNSLPSYNLWYNLVTSLLGPGVFKLLTMTAFSLVLLFRTCIFFLPWVLHSSMWIPPVWGSSAFQPGGASHSKWHKPYCVVCAYWIWCLPCVQVWILHPICDQHPHTDLCTLRDKMCSRKQWM